MKIKYYSNIVIETMISFFNDEALQMHGPADITDAIKGKWQAEINRRRPRRPITDDVNVPLQIILIIIFAGIIMFVNTPGPHAFIAAHFKDALTVVAAILTIIGFFIISFWVIPVLVLIVWGAVALWDLLGEGLQTMISAHGGAALISILLGVLAFKCLLKIVKRGSGKKEMKLYNAENARYLEWSSSTKTKLNSYVATISTLYPEAAASYKKGFDKIQNYEESKERMIQQFGKFKSTLVGAYNEVIKML